MQMRVSRLGRMHSGVAAAASHSLAFALLRSLCKAGTELGSSCESSRDADKPLGMGAGRVAQRARLVRKGLLHKAEQAKMPGVSELDVEHLHHANCQP